MVKESACQCRKHKRHGFNPWVGKIPWRRKWQPALVFNGNINTRKFVVGGRSHGASTGSTWQRYHTYKEIVDGYDRGRDEWAEMTAAETLTVGDDSIPMTHYNWLKSLASTACADVFVDGAWTRCNINGATIECDPRKATFSVSLTLAMPTDDVQQF